MDRTAGGCRLSRRGLLAAGVALASGVACRGAAEGRNMDAFWVFVGTHTGNGASRGIYRLRYDADTGRVGPLELAAETVNPTFLAIHPRHTHLYCVNAVPDGAVSAFALDARTGALTFLNRQPSGGAGPCHLVVDPAARNLLVANYGGGSVAVLPIRADGRLAEPSCVVQHRGSGPNPRRQEAPHAHSIQVDPTGRFALAADLGTDRLMVYRFDPERGTLAPHDPPFAALAPGAGPRHFAFHPNGRFVYVINELNSTVTAFRYDGSAGRLEELRTVSTLPPGWSGENYPAEILVHPSGRHLYGSNRGHDSIARFRIDPETGIPTPAGHTPTGGQWPRNFAFDPGGTRMVVGNQNSNDIRWFRVDATTGELAPVGEPLAAPAPICFKFVPAET